MVNILVLEDDAKLNQAVCTFLNDSGFNAKGCLNANDAYNEMYNNLYEFIISDIMLPEIDGFEFAENVRSLNKHIPILFMSAKDDLNSKQKGFQLGIDDYMVKPVELQELLMRVRALLRRANIETERKLTVGNLEMDADSMSAYIDGEEIPITTREFNILYKLLSYPKKTFSRAQLMDEFWGIDSETSLRAVDVYITKLRDKFSANSRLGCAVFREPFARICVGGCLYRSVFPFHRGCLAAFAQTDNFRRGCPQNHKHCGRDCACDCNCGYGHYLRGLRRFFEAEPFVYLTRNCGSKRNEFRSPDNSPVLNPHHGIGAIRNAHIVSYHNYRLSVFGLQLFQQPDYLAA